MHRVTKIDRMTNEAKQNAIHKFWNLPEEAIFPPEIIALVCDVSLSWLQVKRCKGDGIPFVKIGKRKIGYVKKDVLNFLHNRKCINTIS
jgi:hypothetical protein